MEEALKNVRKGCNLNLSKQELTSFPPKIWELTSFGKIWLNDNKLAALPPEIKKLTHLEELSLGNNLLSTLLLKLNILQI